MKSKLNMEIKVAHTWLQSLIPFLSLILFLNYFVISWTRVIDKRLFLKTKP
jgi:hypothetical protein